MAPEERRKAVKGVLILGAVVLGLLVLRQAMSAVVAGEVARREVPAPAGPVAAAVPAPVVHAHSVEGCKAAIAVIMGRDPATMRGRTLEDGLVHVSYRRPDDGKVWQARCERLDEHRLRWAAFDAFGDGRQGRWRDEDRIEMSVSKGQLEIRVMQDGLDPRSKRYALARLS